MRNQQICYNIFKVFLTLLANNVGISGESYSDKPFRFA